ncbi:hypothetical protein [Hymenobacter psoromatis]|uniref:hypothetical protein n=1 Tax=Hymenobacter psoromatis TaxID=1484116 RepID=UPI001CC19B82|nr:hypothetical protein [Hymenobacter psoromatis]
MEHLICFQVFTTTAALSAFLLENRLVWIQAVLPDLQIVRVRIDTGASTIKPHHVVTLACLLEEYRLADIEIVFELTDCIVCRYLESIGFLSQWGQVGTTGASFTFPNDLNSFVLWRVTRERMNDYVYSAYTHYKVNAFYSKDLTGLFTFLSEVFNNVFDHAFSDDATERVAFAMIQYYPSRERLIFAVADFGMGIPKSVNRYLSSKDLPTVSPTEALQKALQLHFTAHSRKHNQGRGLDTLRTGVEALKGQFTILTSHLLYNVSRKGTVFFQPLPDIDFPGTTVQIRLFKDSLPDEDAEIIEDDVAFL